MTKAQKVPHGGYRVAFEIIDHYDGRDREEVQQVNADGKSHHKKYEDDPFVGSGLIGTVFPFQHHPEYQGGKEGGKGIYLTFNGAEPEGIAESIGQGANGAGGHDGEDLLAVQFAAFFVIRSCGQNG